MRKCELHWHTHTIWPHTLDELLLAAGSTDDATNDADDVAVAVAINHKSFITIHP